MSVTLRDEIVCLEGASRVEDAKSLAAHLQAGQKTVDLSAAGPLHTAVFQVLMAYQPSLQGECRDSFDQKWLAPLLTGRTVT